MKSIHMQSAPATSFKNTAPLFKTTNISVEKKKTDRLSGFYLASLILLGAFFSLWIIKHPLQPSFNSDGGSWSIAGNLLNGNGYSACEKTYFPFCGSTNQATAMREPIPVFLMALSMLIYRSSLSGMILQSLLYLGTIPVIYATLKNQNQRMALLAAALWTLSLPVIREIDNDSGELAAAFFLSLGLFYFINGLRKDKKKYWIIAGVFMGLASLSRSVLFGVSLGLGAVLLLHGIKSAARGWQKLAPALLFTVTCVLVISPWIIRNDVTFGRPIFGSTLVGYNIYRMQYFLADGNFTPHYAGPVDGYNAVMKLVESSKLTGLENEADMQNIYMNAGIKLIEQHPIQYIENSLFRFLQLWFNTSVDKAYDHTPNIVDYVKLLQQGLLLLAVMIGIAKNKAGNWPFVLVLVIGSAAYMAIGAQLRYLVDFMPAVVVLAAYALTPNAKIEDGV